MKLLKILLMGVLSFGCLSSYEQNTPQKEQSKSDTIKVDLSTDSLEYELIIIDPGYEMFLVSQAKPMDYYSQNYYESWNRQYVNAWNNLYISGQYHDIIESYIDYDAMVNYGLEVNYKLYNYFMYCEVKYKLKLLGR